MVKNYLTGIKKDDNTRFAVTANEVDITGLTRNERAWIHWDRSADPIDGNFEYLVDAEINSADNNGLFSPWTLANKVDDINGLVSDAGENALTLFMIRSGSTYVARLMEIHGASSYFDTSTNLSLNTRYYFRIPRDVDIGSFGQLECFLYSDQSRTILVDTLPLTLHVDEDFDLEYGVNSGYNASAPQITGSVANFDSQEEIAGFSFFFDDGGHY